MCVEMGKWEKWEWRLENEEGAGGQEERSSLSLLQVATLPFPNDLELNKILFSLFLPPLPL
jgi:hypothetical protein